MRCLKYCSCQGGHPCLHAAAA
ncbi:SWIM zinc finger family protein [Pseudoxanthomonas sp. PXM03]|nr:SWIM zinc finger family protein [Pseudoxanthomonas sp. PXM03]